MSITVHIRAWTEGRIRGNLCVRVKSTSGSRHSDNPLVDASTLWMNFDNCKAKQLTPNGPQFPKCVVYLMYVRLNLERQELLCLITVQKEFTCKFMYWEKAKDSTDVKIQ